MVTGLGISSDGYTDVEIIQIGAGNKLSSSDNSSSNGPAINSISGAYTSLRTNQFGDGSAQNTIGVDAYTNDDTTINIYQGRDNQRVGGNNVSIKLGTANTRSSAEIYIDQQSNKNTTVLNLGQTNNFNGRVNVTQQTGDGNRATLNLLGGNSYNVRQNGKENELTVTTAGVNGDVNVTMGGNSYISNNNQAILNLGNTRDTQVMINGEYNTVNFDWSNANNDSYSRNLTVSGSHNNFYTTSWNGYGKIQLNNVTIGDDNSRNLYVSATTNSGDTYLNNITITGSDSRANFQNSVISAGGRDAKSTIQLDKSSFTLANSRIDSADVSLGNYANAYLYGVTTANNANLAINSNGGNVTLGNMTFNSDSSFTQENNGSIYMQGGSVWSASIYQSGDNHVVNFNGGNVNTGYINLIQTDAGVKKLTSQTTQMVQTSMFVKVTMAHIKLRSPTMVLTLSISTNMATQRNCLVPAISTSETAV